jgi:hypothetical protein
MTPYNGGQKDSKSSGIPPQAFFLNRSSQSFSKMLEVVLDPKKPRVSCHNLLPPKRRIASRYDVKIETY